MGATPADEVFLQETLAHLDMLYTLARRITFTAAEAEDLVQETYTRALPAWRRGRPERVAPWLATICLNLGRSQHRRRASRPQEVLDPRVGMHAVAADDTETAALAQIDRDSVHRAVARLSREQREAVTLMDLCGFSASQVADMLDVPRNTVLARVHRGHKQLAGLLGEAARRDP